jgi:hypothetical protein
MRARLSRPSSEFSGFRPCIPDVFRNQLKATVLRLPLDSTRPRSRSARQVGRPQRISWLGRTPAFPALQASEKEGKPGTRWRGQTIAVALLVRCECMQVSDKDHKWRSLRLGMSSTFLASVEPCAAILLVSAGEGVTTGDLGTRAGAKIDTLFLKHAAQRVRRLGAGSRVLR